jgi:hypothetical protein
VPPGPLRVGIAKRVQDRTNWRRSFFYHLRCRELEIKTNGYLDVGFPGKISQHHLLFVRRKGILLQRGNVFAADALLGRFLPRLGPPVATQAASFI